MADDTLTVIEFADLSAERRAQLWGSDPDPFEMAHDTMQWQVKHRHVGLEDAQGRLVACTGLAPTRIRAADRREHAAIGLGGVIVAQAHRGRGLARRIVGQALELAASLGPDLVMLFCLPSRVGLYERLGFSEVAPPVLVAQPGGPRPVSLIVMWRTLAPEARLPPTPVQVLTLPF
jgi:predicted N-acetyltransferase YhbS